MQPDEKQICVRLAQAEDVEALAELLSILFQQEADFTPDIARQKWALQMIVTQPEVGQIFCATDGDEIVGMVSILFTVSTAEGGRAAWLEDMVVHPTKRGQGVGERLLQEAMTGAQLAGCSRITLLTDSTNDGAQRFYERAGFVRSQMVPFRIYL